MGPPEHQRLHSVRDYHERTKHRPDRFAASLGYLDWANQPDPFRRFAGTASVDLPRPALRQEPVYDALFGRPPAAAPLDADLVGRLFLHSLALSAWKQAPGTSNAARTCRPHSGGAWPMDCPPPAC